MCGVLCQQVSSQNKKIPFNDRRRTSSDLNMPQYYMIKNTARSLISFLYSSDFIINQSYSEYYSTACSASPDKPNFFLLILSVRFLFPLKNLSNHAPLVGVAVTTTFLYALVKVSDTNSRDPSLQIILYASEYLPVLFYCK